MITREEAKKLDRLALEWVRKEIQWCGGGDICQDDVSRNAMRAFTDYLATLTEK